MAALFITATGTDIGKTFVAAGLARHLREQGQRVSIIKPVVSGFDAQTMAQSDPAVLLTALGEPVTEETIGAIAPWRFAAPLSPDMAAAREGRTVPFEDVVAFTRVKVTAAFNGVLIVEGVGGVMVPLDRQHTVLDWISALRIPIVLVTGSYLGTISHTLTALHVIARRNLQLAAVVVSESAESTVPFDETCETIAHFTTGLPFVPMRRGGDHEAAFAAIAAVIG